jgi:hypothetical protein
MIDIPWVREACFRYQKTLRGKYEPFRYFIDVNNKSGGRNAYVVDTRTCEEVMSTYPEQVANDTNTSNIIFLHCAFTFEERENWLTGKIIDHEA